MLGRALICSGGQKIDVSLLHIGHCLCRALEGDLGMALRLRACIWLEIKSGEDRTRSNRERG